MGALGLGISMGLHEFFGIIIFCGVSLMLNVLFIEFQIRKYGT